MSLDQALEFENRLFAIVSGSEDREEGVAAFLENGSLNGRAVNSYSSTYYFIKKGRNKR